MICAACKPTFNLRINIIWWNKHRWLKQFRITMILSYTFIYRYWISCACYQIASNYSFMHFDQVNLQKNHFSSALLQYFWLFIGTKQFYTKYLYFHNTTNITTQIRLLLSTISHIPVMVSLVKIGQLIGWFGLQFNFMCIMWYTKCHVLF